MSAPSPTASSTVARVEAHRAHLLQEKRVEGALYGTGLLVCLAAAVVVGQFYPQSLADGLPRIGEYFGRILPTLSADTLFADAATPGSVAHWYYAAPRWAALLFETVQMAVLAAFLGVGGAFFMCFPASRNLVRRYWIYFVFRRTLEFFRSVPELVIALIFVWAFGVGPLAGILAIAIHSAGALGKLFAEVNENIDMRPLDGIRAAGGNWFQIVRYGVVPQILPNFASYALLRFEFNIRGAAVIGFVGAGGIGQELMFTINFNAYEDVSAIVLMIIGTVSVIDLVSERVRTRFITGRIA